MNSVRHERSRPFGDLQLLFVESPEAVLLAKEIVMETVQPSKEQFGGKLPLLLDAVFDRSHLPFTRREYKTQPKDDQIKKVLIGGKLPNFIDRRIAGPITSPWGTTTG